MNKKPTYIGNIEYDLEYVASLITNDINLMLKEESMQYEARAIAVKMNETMPKEYYIQCTVRPVFYIDKEKTIRTYISHYNKDGYIKHRATIVNEFIKDIKKYHNMLSQQIAEELNEEIEDKKECNGKK